MERRTIVCYLGGIWRRLEQLEFTAVFFWWIRGPLSLECPTFRENTVYIKTHKTAINRPVDLTGET